jgi:phytoene dehydrogenase-like protein
MSVLDAIVIGAGHNGLTCATYLGMAGLRVRVFERRGVVGGACVTEEFYPGFRNSTAAYTVSLLQPKVISDLKLHEHGLRIVERRAQNFLPLPDGRHLLASADCTEREIAKFSAKDAGRYSAYQAEISRVAGAVRSLALNAPPNLMLGGLTNAAREIGKLTAIGKKLWQDDSLQAVYQLVRKSAGDLLDNWFESDPIKAILRSMASKACGVTPSVAWAQSRRPWRALPADTAYASMCTPQCAKSLSSAVALLASC